MGATFAYDALGRRAGKTINGQATSFRYDGLDVTLDDGATGSASYLRTLGIDEALTRTDNTTSVSYVADALGSTVALADTTGAIPVMGDPLAEQGAVRIDAWALLPNYTCGASSVSARSGTWDPRGRRWLESWESRPLPPTRRPGPSLTSS